MAFERSLPGTGIGAEPAPHPATDRVPEAIRLQILSTEHWSLLATRSLSWNEAFSRAGMFLTTLSGAMVALALVAQASGFDQSFALFALAVLPVALFVGVTTYLRLGSANYHDAVCVVGMNRIRGAYLELAPELERYFVMSANDDPRGVDLTMGVRAGSLAHILSGTPTLVMVLNSTLAAVIALLATIQLGGGTAVGLVLGIAAFVLSASLHVRHARRDIAQGRQSLVPVFPSPMPAAVATTDARGD
jgi:hypothetical protein